MMAAIFGGGMAKPPNPAEALRKDVRIAVRRMDRKEVQSTKQESILLNKIKQLAGQGKVDNCQSVAKELVRLRTHTRVLGQMRSQLTGLSQKLSVAESTSNIHLTLSSTAKLLAGLNKTLAPKEMQRVLMQFQRENTVFSDAQEILGETLEDAFEGEDEGANIDAAVSKVLQEVGLDALAFPSPGPMKAHLPVADDDLVRRLENLRC